MRSFDWISPAWVYLFLYSALSFPPLHLALVPCSAHGPPYSANPNAVSCFNFHSLHKTERSPCRVVWCPLSFSNFISASLSFQPVLLLFISLSMNVPRPTSQIPLSFIYFDDDLWIFDHAASRRKNSKKIPQSIQKKHRLLCHADIMIILIDAGIKGYYK